MTDFETILEWYAPETVTLYCDECGKPMESVDGRRRKILCPECKAVRANESSKRTSRNRGLVQYKFDDPEVNLVYAVINQALEDRDLQRRFNPDGHELSLVDCGAREFIEDGGVELWLGALGVGVKPSMIKAIKESE